MQQQVGRAAAAASQQQAPAAAAGGPSRASSLHEWEPAKTQPISPWGAAKEGAEFDEEEEDPCVICHEEMLLTDTVTLHCGHRFHPEV